MALNSMTGFARADGGDAMRWTWELRSVNGKGLDVRIRLPSGFERIERDARDRCTTKLGRGNVQVSLSTTTVAGAQTLTINEDVLARVIDAMARIGQKIEAQPPTLDGILALRGVVEVEDIAADETARDALDVEILAGLDAALVDLAAMRGREGAAIGALLSARLDELASLTAAAEASPARQPEAIRARLAEQVATLLDAAPALDPDRLHQEAVLLATKADIREELDRLHAHIAATRDLLAEGGPIGRRLDFLAQEFNREVNTLCAKSNDRALTAIGLDMKAVVDQLREQIQNLE
ncbi:YicC/YloC family endoribonuclease [Bauldia litoralis]|uniref:TIGR00255 family protein n=1 Tax=Bauldia litoralis TaxID=665467 RepID=A0A1G6DGP2_9HYPH|nr:YicC/YloC family endoribonuclease [Bauldia litoralis]SDB44296.1 TIGR00255 family protein [Bauldia litoralis]